MYIPILAYHRILNAPPDRTLDPKRIAVSADQFYRHLRCLAWLGYQTIPLLDYARRLKQGRPPPPKSFAITFDDGYEEVLTLGLPILQMFGFRATVFAVPGQLGGNNTWDDGRARLLSTAQYKTLQQAGIEIGAHTSSHVHLPNVGRLVAHREITESKKRLEDMLSQSVPLFAYPYGESNSEVEDIVKQSGFEAAFATDRAPARPTENLFRIRRIVIFPRTTPTEIFWKSRSWYPHYQDWKRRD